MIFKRLKKSTREDEQQFSDMFEEEKVGWKDKLAMLIASFFTIMIPCILILVAFGAFMIWILSVMS